MSFPPPFPVPHAPPPKATIKLALEAPNAEKEGPFVRVPLSGAITSETMDHLKERALDLWKLHNAPGKHQMPKAKVTFTYRDIENDLCYIFSDDDLRSALPLFPASLRVFVRVDVPMKKAAAEKEKAAAAVVPEETKDKAEEIPAPEATAPPTEATNNNKTTQTSSNRSVSDVPAHKVVESLVGVLTTAAVALQGNVKPSKEDETKNEVRLFIHGRHTCDGCLTTPIVGTRWHATNLPDYDLCGACKDNYKGSEVTFEAAELDRDRPMQERWNRRFSKVQAKQDKKQEKWVKKQEKRTNKQVPLPEAAKPSPLGPPFHPPPFCGGPPPHHGPPHHGPPHHGPPHHGPPHHAPWGPRRGRWGHHPRYYAAQPEQVDKALQEAIRRSQAELEAAQHKANQAVAEAAAEAEALIATEEAKTEEPKAEAKTEEPKAEPKKEEEEEFEIPPAAPVGAHPAPRSAEEEETKLAAVVPAVIEKEESKQESEESFSDDAQGNGDVAVSLGETMDMIASAVDEMKDLLSRDSEADSNKNEEEEVVVNAPEEETEEKAGATIVQGEEEEEEVKSTDGSENSWNVVAGDQLAADEALARAAHVIGSALFESGTAESNNPSMLGSDHSVPTTLPSVASQNGVVQDAQAQRWALHLSQLHELGFLNDALSVDIMERLEAADIGSGETQEVTVERVVNELMKDW